MCSSKRICRPMTDVDLALRDLSESGPLHLWQFSGVGGHAFQGNIVAASSRLTALEFCYDGIGSLFARAGCKIIREAQDLGPALACFEVYMCLNHKACRRYPR